ncbi:MAG: ABC transporter ATP-binding protein [Candidatus Eremiobacteraeota bacterium]|nr:ABC transporter ATP-binding protein [Candidatus Eremiobacteraeota bacterium]
MHPPALSVQALTKLYGTRRALEDASFDVFEQERCVVLGASGAGKTTLLRLIAGLEEPNFGSIAIGGDDVTRVPPQLRSTSLLFSQGALFPHMSAFENLAFAVRANGKRPASVRSEVIETAELLQITPHLATPARALSAGERQRVALGRALLRAPMVLLLDEPVAHLDPPLRESVRNSIIKSALARKIAMLYVTHDHEDAFAVADRIAVLIDGRIAQIDSPQAIYDFPATLDVARFIGPVPMNLFTEETDVLGVRAEHVTLIDEGGDVTGVVVGSALAGASRLVRVKTNRGEARVSLTSGVMPAIGTSVGLQFAPEHVRRFDRATGHAK